MVACGWCSCRCLFFKQKTAYEMRISDWSSDVCSSDLELRKRIRERLLLALEVLEALDTPGIEGEDAEVALTREILRAHRERSGETDAALRSEERRVGKEGVSTCRSRWSPSP